mgnify:CR=1 FL=1
MALTTCHLFCLFFLLNLKGFGVAVPLEYAPDVDGDTFYNEVQQLLSLNRAVRQVRSNKIGFILSIAYGLILLKLADTSQKVCNYNCYRNKQFPKEFTLNRNPKLWKNIYKIKLFGDGILFSFISLKYIG